MKFTLSWLRDHLDTDADLTTIADTLTRIGLEVDAIHDPAAQLAPFIIARVIAAEPHPNADRLRVCQVDTGANAPVQVVCGAPNARAGMRSVFSPPGTFIPGKKITLGTGVIRGVESLGMLCSAAELELSDDHDGIIDLPDDAPVGESYARWAKLDDPVIEINLTPNRPDATSVYGIARDLAAAGLGRLKDDAIGRIDGAFPCPVSVTLALNEDDAHLATLFALRLVRGVRNGPSPDWLQRRLKAIGSRPINALVDITNYVTFDRGRPLHVFDARKVGGDLTVRRAQSGENLLALDGRTYMLDESTVVIADGNGVESIAGIMGGEASGCDDATTDVLIESALWDPINIARSGRKLGIVTDARYRFERGVDPAFCIPGAELATRLVLELCGGTPSALVVAGKAPEERPAILFPWSEVARLTGLELPVGEMAGILEKLGFAVQSTPGNADRAIVTPPSWRPDIEGPADLVEEIVRIVGLDRVAPVPLPPLTQGVARPVLTLLQKRTSLARRALASRGLVEAVTWSFVPHAAAAAFGGGHSDLVIANPIATDLSDMRPSLVPGLLAAAGRNSNRGLGDVGLFEVGQVFANDTETGQRTAAAILRRGTAKPDGAGRDWSGRASAVTVFDAKADAFALLAALGISATAVQVAPGGPPFLHPGRSGTLQFGPKLVVGWFGELHPRVLEELDVTGPVVAVELILDALPAPKTRPTRAKPKLALSDLMPVGRDFAFIVDRSVRAADILKAVQGADRALITDASVFDVYEGPEIGPERKSVAVAVTMQPRERTMTDAEIESVAAKVVSEVAKRTGATLRS